MNLSAYFGEDTAIREASLVDHDWLTDPESVMDLSNMKKNNNMKPELEVSWGLATGPDFDIDEPAGEVKRNIPEDNLGDADKVVLFARDLMNRGLRGSKVASELKSRFPSALLATAQEGLREMFAMEGLIGRVMIDARGYKNCQAAMKAASNNPYKRFIKHVYGCHCGDPHMIHANDVNIIGDRKASSGNGFDDFFGSDDRSESMVSHCRTTMLPIYARGDLDRSDMDSTLIEMGEVTTIPQTVLSKIRDASGSNVWKIKKAFRYLDKVADENDRKQYASKIDASEYLVERADNEIELGAEAMSDIEVDPTSGDLFSEIETEKFVPTNFDGPSTLNRVLDEVDVMDDTSEEQIPVEELDVSFDNVEVADDNSEEQIHVELMDENNVSKLQLDDVIFAPEQLAVDEHVADLEADVQEFDTQDVDMDQFFEEEFEGTDEFALDDERDIPMDLNVEIGDMADIEL